MRETCGPSGAAELQRYRRSRKRAVVSLDFTIHTPTVSIEGFKMARRCFADTFGHLFDPQSFEHFLDEAYGDDGSMSKDLLDSAIEWFTAETADKL